LEKRASAAFRLDSQWLTASAARRAGFRRRLDSFSTLAGNRSLRR
jgi:hypothetical protein